MKIPPPGKGHWACAPPPDRSSPLVCTLPLWALHSGCEPSRGGLCRLGVNPLPLGRLVWVICEFASFT